MNFTWKFSTYLPSIVLNLIQADMEEDSGEEEVYSEEEDDDEDEIVQGIRVGQSVRFISFN